MKIHYYQDKIHNIDICCQMFCGWLFNGLLDVIPNEDEEKCTTLLRISEDGERIHYCSFCGAQIEFIQE
jgi:hypothetical protein